MNPRERPGVDMRGIEHGEVRSFGAAVETLHDQPAVVARGAGPCGKDGLSGNDVLAEIEQLRRLAAIIHAFDAAVRHGRTARGQISDIVLLHCDAWIDHREFMRSGVEVSWRSVWAARSMR